ncbi:MAG: putative toxin-antitoxin system toxin component, PIN family [Thermoleophilia bacterium]
MRAGLDTNVLVSAFIAGGPPSRLLEEAIDGRFELILFGPVVVELERVLTEKLDFEAQRWSEAEALLRELALESVRAPAGAPEPVTGDPADDLILACAVEAGVDVLASGDRKHLLPVGERGGVRILTPQALLAELRGD